MLADIPPGDADDWHAEQVGLKLAPAKLPGYVCEAFFGHSEAIANKRYRLVQEEHFELVSGIDCAKQGNVAQIRGPNMDQTAVATSSNASYKKTKNPGFTEVFLPVPARTDGHVPPRGVESTAVKCFVTIHLRRIGYARWRKFRRTFRRIRSQFAVA